MPKAISYIRFSSGTQAKGSTTRRQQDRIDDWLAENPNIELSELSQADMGRSGFNGENLKYGLGKILDAIEEGRIRAGDYLLLESIDRFGRQEELETLDIIQKIISKGIKIVTLSDKQIYSKDSMSGDTLQLHMLLLKITQANSYSKLLSDRIKKSYNAKRKQARDGKGIRIYTPFWLNTNGEIIQERAEPVLYCIELYLKGHGTLKIFKELTELYPITNKIYPTTIKRWLKNPALMGTWQNRNDPIDNVFEPLISQSKFLHIQNETKRRSKESSRSGDYVLSGLVKCRLCGKNYHYRRKVYKSGVIVYCHCSTTLKKGVKFCKNNKSWPYEVLNTILEETLESSLEKFTTQQVTNRLSLELDIKRDKLSELERTREKAYDLYLSTDGDSSFEKRRYEEIKKEIEEAKKEASKLEIAVEREAREFLTQDAVKTANDLYLKLTSNPVELRESLKKVGYKILTSPNSATVKNSDHLQSYMILRRSQRHGCYIVKKRASLLKSDTSGRKIHPTANEKERAETKNPYYAIDRVGVICTASSESRLIEQLEKIKRAITEDPEMFTDGLGEVSAEMLYEKLHGDYREFIGAEEHARARIKDEVEYIKSGKKSADNKNKKAKSPAKNQR